MQNRFRILSSLMTAALAAVVVACSTPAAVEPSDGRLATPGASSAAVPSPTGSSPSASPGTPQPSLLESPTPSSSNPATAALAGRSWAKATLTEVPAGQTFTIAGLAGRTIFVEMMAIWCTKCREQQFRFKEALGRLDANTVAYVVLTVDPSETAAELARYKRDRGFVGIYAVAGRDVAADLAKEFGPNVLNPPTVPLILITTTGEIRFKTGGESVADIVQLGGG